tara:strand:- start:24 stop:239 length:216 start_codon:yes stop_codon:yes gene_type:complete
MSKHRIPRKRKKALKKVHEAQLELRKVAMSCAIQTIINTKPIKLSSILKKYKVKEGYKEYTWELSDINHDN